MNACQPSRWNAKLEVCSVQQFLTPSSLLWSDSVTTEELGGNFQTTKIWAAAQDVFSIVAMVRFSNNKATEVSGGDFQTTKIWAAAEDVFSSVTVISL